MIDIHTHILPGIDDGSSSVDESIEMISMLYKQGVDTIVTTPHFYIGEMDFDDFLRSRQEAFDSVLSAIKEMSQRPKLVSGAEVQFYSELYSMNGVENLCIGGSRYLLVEMPFVKWTQHTYNALSRLYWDKGIIPIVAHVERYFSIQRDDGIIGKLRDANALIQMSGRYLISRCTRKKALDLVDMGAIDFVASDCHGVNERKPNMGKAYEVMLKKIGTKGIEGLEYFENKIKDEIIFF